MLCVVSLGVVLLSAVAPLLDSPITCNLLTAQIVALIPVRLQCWIIQLVWPAIEDMMQHFDRMGSLSVQRQIYEVVTGSAAMTSSMCTDNTASYGPYVEAGHVAVGKRCSRLDAMTGTPFFSPNSVTSGLWYV